jgi:hypothetical protein
MTLEHIEKEVDSALKMGEPGGVIDPVRLEKDSTFNFRCYPGISCFNRCCHNVNIILTPSKRTTAKDLMNPPSGLLTPGEQTRRPTSMTQ